MNGIYTILLLIVSNAFMTLAWYGHLKLNSFDKFQALPLITIILISWGIAFFEYCFQVPANRIGFRETQSSALQEGCHDRVQTQRAGHDV